MFRSALGAIAAGAMALTAPAVLTLSAATPAHAQAQRDTEAENFVSLEANRALKILNDTAMGREAKKQAFHGFVDQVADVPRITGFVLGKYRRSLTAAQYAEFAEVFRRYADSVYESRLGQYHGERLEVTGSTVRTAGDVVVATKVVGGRIKNPTQVLWRVIRGADGRYRAVDVSVEGIWLAITEQQDFVSTLDNNHGDINVLISQLRTQTEREEAGRR